ncbi:MAG: type III-B CRISPR module RAMP protein Cmr4 [Bacteroidetes bacterium]|nr:type III-B CRISPR module RAMP protein Cmr4 [Bacteroidota bacterium]
MNTPNPEFNYKVAVFTITAKTNLHVGSGSQNYGIIDNMVQRDPLTGFPCIYSSSLKGAIREYFRYYLKEEDASFWSKERIHDFLFHVFGFAREDSIENEETEIVKPNAPEIKQQPGKYRFLQADLLSIPVRSDKRLFYRTTCPYLLSNFKDASVMYKSELKPEYLNALNSINSTLIGNDKAIHFDTGVSVLEETDILAEPRTAIPNLLQLNDIAGNELAIVKDIEFAELVSDFHLPVIARNNLADGRSTNLWYEQVLPSETRFWFGVLYPESDSELENFIRIIQLNPVQIGANASIGYGFCKISLAGWFVSPIIPQSNENQ